MARRRRYFTRNPPVWVGGGVYRHMWTVRAQLDQVDPKSPEGGATGLTSTHDKPSTGPDPKRVPFGFNAATTVSQIKIAR